MYQLVSEDIKSEPNLTYRKNEEKKVKEILYDSGACVYTWKELDAFSFPALTDRNCSKLLSLSYHSLFTKKTAKWLRKDYFTRSLTEKDSHSTRIYIFRYFVSSSLTFVVTLKWYFLISILQYLYEHKLLKKEEKNIYLLQYHCVESLYST